MSPPKMRISHSIGKLYGRETELKVLRGALRRAKESGHPAELVFVSGASGTGKSTLLEHAFQGRECIFGSGKFDQRRDPKPFAGLFRCLSGICQGLSQSQGKEEYAERLQKEFKKEEISGLGNLIPGFEDAAGVGILLKKDAGSSRSLKSTCLRQSNKDGLEQLKYTLRLFLRVISSPTRPVLMHLDDLHWIDPGTMIVLKYLLNDPELQNMVFIGSYRDNEITDDHMLRQWIQSRSDSPIQINLGNLQVEHVNNLLAESLKVDDVAELADLIYNRTNGNAFHILQLLDYMQDEELLEFSNFQFFWVWDIVKIRDQTVLSDNLVDIVGVKLNRLPSQVQACVSLCSYLGFRIDEEMLYSVSSVIPDHQVPDLAGALETAIAEGLLERVREKRLKFVHDKIHQAALQLIPNEKDQQRLYYTIGQSLYQTYGLGVKDRLDDARDRVVFLCAHLLNLGSNELSKTDGFRTKLSELNCQAGERAAVLSAFLPSLDYLQAGIDLLDPERCWLDQYDLTLELYTSLAEMCYCTGHIDRHKLAVEQVLKNAKSVDDRIRVYLVSLQNYSGQDQYQELVDTALKFLDELGEGIAAKPSLFRVHRKYMQTKRKLAAMSDEDIQALPLMSNERKAMAVQVLCEMLITADTEKPMQLVVMASLRSIELTLEYGLAPYSALAFTIIGGLFAMLYSGIKLGCRLSRLATSVLQALDDNETAGRVMVYQCALGHWTEPLGNCTDRCIQGHQLGMRTGDLKSS
jgi:predicted ATPase